MCRPHVTFYTKRQVQSLMDGWSCKEPVPAKGKKVMICFPLSMEPYAVDLVEIEWTDRKSSQDDKSRLWAVTQSSKEGRAFQAAVQESHVVDFMNEQLRRRRATNLAMIFGEIPH